MFERVRQKEGLHTLLLLFPEMAEYDDFEDSFESSSESDTEKQPYETKEDKWDQSYEQCETIPHVKSAQCELELSSDIALQ